MAQKRANVLGAELVVDPPVDGPPKGDKKDSDENIKDTQDDGPPKGD